MCGAQAAKEHITRPLDPAEVQLIDRAMQALDQDYRLQRRLEDLYALPTSRSDSRTVITNRWRLLPLLPYLGLQVGPPAAQLGPCHESQATVDRLHE